MYMTLLFLPIYDLQISSVKRAFLLTQAHSGSMGTTILFVSRSVPQKLPGRLAKLSWRCPKTFMTAENVSKDPKFEARASLKT